MKKLLLACALAPSLLVAQTPSDLDDGIRLQKERKYEQARDAFERALRAAPANVEAHVRLCELYTQRFDDTDKAISHGLSAVKGDERSARAHLRLAAAYGVAGMRAGLLKGLSIAKKYKTELERAAQLEPKNVEPKEQLFWFYLQVPGIAGGDADKARALAEETLAVDEAMGRQMRARIARKRKDDAAALLEYRRALAAAPERAALLNELAYFHLEGKRLDEARPLFEKALELSPDEPNAHDSIAEYYVAAARLDDAVRELQRALELDPGFVASLYHLGEAYEKKADKVEAVKCYERCAALRPVTRWAKLSKARLKEIS